MYKAKLKKYDIFPQLYKINNNVNNQQLYICNSSHDLTRPSHWTNMQFMLGAANYKVYIGYGLPVVFQYVFIDISTSHMYSTFKVIIMIFLNHTT